ncbi:uncharacterized protein NECHADRAFT_78337 [Fusarium vanettenii 77-13-4]|uniref:Uncharacterized protein n=1 Tax=Fusarium vanettenii (strain ATCC MYA-4622 / CBS 123669 / FGSC 9596 / NRRL 45880 / 77-13-4) TaxID=660122 RepID=C7ZFI6_FUSV7|nr:uncharacterized protein NECHADRAFT_78337 [Fusarium vanettenii 77-13-4]EEU37250.1 predicted protein [Fusarium vanettenii 77-13-4]
MSFDSRSRSIVPVDGPVRYLYELANSTNYEHKSVKFWSLWLQYVGFPEHDWLVTTEQPPDGSESLRRVDIVIDKYNPNENTLSSVVWVEAKKPGGDYNTVYRQALDAAQRAISYEGLYRVYAVTTVGTAFCMWYLQDGKPDLTPLNRARYIDADSEESYVMAEGIATIKSNPPLRVAPTIPSQPFPALDAQETPAHGARIDADVASDQQIWIAQDDNQQGSGHDHGQSYGQLEPGESHAQQEPDPVPSAGSSGAPTVSTKYHKVHVVKKGLLGGDYCFQDHRGKERKTKKGDWTKGKYKGQRVWLYKGGHNDYYTKELP